MEGNTQVLEINLISAQGLKPPSSNLRRFETYALVWVDPSAKLRTRVDGVGGENPTWNDKFLFRISPDFIASDTSAVTVEIYSVGYVKDFLMGAVRFLLSNCFGKLSASADVMGTPAFSAVQIRRPSGRFRGILNIAAAVYSCAEFPFLKSSLAICIRDLIGESDKDKDKESVRRRRRLSRVGSKRSEQSSGGESLDFDLLSLDLSDGTDSSTSSSSAASTALKEWNGARRGMAGKLKELKSGGGGFLCGLMLQRKSCSSDQNVPYWDESFEENQGRNLKPS